MKYQHEGRDTLRQKKIKSVNMGRHKKREIGFVSRGLKTAQGSKAEHGTKDLVIETSRTVIKGVTNLLGNSWTRCWSFSFIWRFCCFQIRKFHIRHLKSQNLPPIRMPNIRISWDVGQQKRLFCLSLLTSLRCTLCKYIYTQGLCVKCDGFWAFFYSLLHSKCK